MVLIIDPSSSLSSRWDKFLVSLFISIQFFFLWVAGFHLIIWDVFHKTISSLFFSLLVFPITPFDPSPKDTFSSSFVAEVGIFFYILLSQLSWFYSFSRRSSDVVFSLLISVCQNHVQFLPFTVEVLSKLYQSYSFSILFNRSVVSSAQVLFTVSSLA